MIPGFSGGYFRLHKAKNFQVDILKAHHLSLLRKILYRLRRNMISSSVRRVAFTSPPTPIASSIKASAPRIASSYSRSYRCHQRRPSSSKPSSPADGSKGVADGQAVSAAPAQARPDSEKKSSRTSRRKAKDVVAHSTVKVRDEAMQNLPSVPSTQHIAPNRKLSLAFVLARNNN